MRGHDEEADLDDARAAWRGYQQWQRQQYHDTPREYWDALDTSHDAFTTPDDEETTDDDQ